MIRTEHPAEVAPPHATIGRAHRCELTDEECRLALRVLDDVVREGIVALVDIPEAGSLPATPPTILA